MKVIWAAVIFLAFLGVAVAVRRTVVLVSPGAMSSSRNPAASLDAHFRAHRTVTLLHILPGMIFMILGPLQFVPRIRAKRPGFHRWSGRVFLSASAIIGITGLVMASRDTIGGADEKAAIFLFGCFFLVALGRALWHALRREFAEHREWMIRGYAVGLAVATIRPIMAAFFAAAVISAHTPQPSQFFGTAFWIGFTLQTIVAEIWIRHTRSARVEIRAQLSSNNA
jgi:uncharacterized membrane protein